MNKERKKMRRRFDIFLFVNLLIFYSKMRPYDLIYLADIVRRRRMSLVTDGIIIVVVFTAPPFLIFLLVQKLQDEELSFSPLNKVLFLFILVQSI